MKKIIIIGLTPQGLSVLRTLSRAGADVTAFYMNKRNVGVYSKYGRKIQFLDISDLKCKLHDVLDNMPDRPLCYITSGELLALILREYKELYSECDVVSGPYEVIEKLSHKDEMYKIAIEKGFNVARHITLNNYKEGSFSYPIFMKRNYEIPLFFKAVRLDSHDEMRDYLKKIYDSQKKDILVQELIDIPNNQLMEISAQVLYAEGKAYGYLITNQYRRLSKGLTSMIIELEEGELKSHIEYLCSAFMEDLSYTGVAEFEFMLNKSNGELFFVEVNTRTCGLQSSLSHKFSNIGEVLMNPHNAHLLQVAVPRLKWMNITRDVRARLQKRDFKHMHEIFQCKYDILDMHDLKPFFRQFL